MVFAVTNPDGMHDIMVYGKLWTESNGNYYWKMEPVLDTQDSTILWLANNPVERGGFNISYHKNEGPLFAIEAYFAVMLKLRFQFSSTKSMHIQTVIRRGASGVLFLKRLHLLMFTN